MKTFQKKLNIRNVNVNSNESDCSGRKCFCIFNKNYISI